MMDRSLESRIWGCLLGGAIGNAMGSPVENWHYERIEATYGKIEMPLDLGRIKTEDDYQIARLYTQAYLRFRRAITPENLAKVWLEKFDRADNFFWCLRNALELLRRGISPRQSGLYNINTGSAIMAISPVGVFHMLEPDQAYAEALSLAYMYQPKPDAHCAAALASGYAMAFKPDITPREIANTILEHCLDESIQYWDDRKVSNIKEAVEIAIEIAGEFGTNWWDARQKIYEMLGQWHPIEPIEVLSISTCLFLMTRGEYTGGLIAGTNIGRDSDTIANIIGGLCGAMQGVNAIPAEWKEGVHEINPALYQSFKDMARDYVTILDEKWQHSNQCAKLMEQLIYG